MVYMGSNSSYIVMEQRALVGIDLGNSYVRVYFAGKAIVMYNSLLLEKGNAYVNKKPTNDCLVDIPLLAGFKFDDTAFQEVAKHYNYIFRKGGNRSILMKLQHETAFQEFHPELALLLMLRGVFMTNPHLKYLITQKSIKMVVTVFEGDSNSYRLALSHSLKIAGISHYSFVSSSSCIAVAYLRDNKQQRDEREVVGIVDFGDRGLSVAVCKVYSQELGVVEVLKSEVSHMGGNYITNLLVDYVVRQLSRQKGMDVSKTPKIMHRLKTLCDEAKQTLSQSEMAFIRLDGLPDILVYGCEVSVGQFQKCIEKALQVNINLIRTTLGEFQVGKMIINGSSSKIPAFRSMIAQQLKQYKAIPCNEDWVKEGITSIKAGTFQVLEVTSFDLRIQGDEKYSCIAIAKGESIPLRKKIVMKFPSGQLTYSMKFYQNGLLVASCMIPQRPSETKYNLYVELDRNKLLNIYVTNTKGLIKMNCNMMDLPKETYLKYGELITQIDFHNEND